MKNSVVIRIASRSGVLALLVWVAPFVVESSPAKPIHARSTQAISIVDESGRNSPVESRKPGRDVVSKIEVSKKSVQVAEPFRLDLKVYHSINQRVNFASVSDSLGPFTIVESKQQIDLPSSKGRESILTLQLEAWESGTLTIPGLEFELLDSIVDEGKTSGDASPIEKQSSVHLYSEPQTIKVVSVRTKNEVIQKLREVAGVQDAGVIEKNSGLRWQWYVTGATVMAALLALGLWVRNKPKSQVSIADWATSRLGELKFAPIGQRIDWVDSEASRLAMASSVLRDYLNLRFGLNASIGTVPETLLQLKDQGWSPAFLARLKRWLLAAEQVSFAGIEVDSTEVEAAIEEAITLVEEAESMQPVLDQNDQPVYRSHNSGVSN